jgi:hypothetical protein
MAFHEVIPADEAVRFEAYARELTELQKKRAEKRGSIARALHVKQHVGLVADFAVKGGGPGLFAEAKSYPAYIRLSNGSASVQSDKAPDQRGFAVKLVGVDGKKIIPGLEDKKTQDFLFITSPALPVKNADEFIGLVRSLKDGPAKLVPRLIGQVGFFRALSIVKASLTGPKPKSFATSPFYTGAPISWGDSAAKLAIVPVSAPSASVDGSDFFRDDIIARVKQGPIVYSVRAQTFVDDTSTPIEDASIDWSSPYAEVATLTIAKQEPSAKLDDLVSTMSFDPWHALAGHRPLGGIMRARAVAYRESVIARKAADEPTEVVRA